MAKVNQRGVKKISRPARNVNLVVCAMRNLGDENGSTVGNIVGYLADCCERPAPKREVIINYIEKYFYLIFYINEKYQRQKKNELLIKAIHYKNKK